MLRSIRHVCAQPATMYYAWQVEVMLNNFLEVGINLNQVDIVCAKPKCVMSEEWTKLAQRYPARFFFYCDNRTSRNYISSVRPNVLRQHFAKFPELSDEIIFYHDCDIAFTRNPMSWITDEMLADDKWYGSDTKWYIAYDYIKGKGDDVLALMERVMRMGEGVVKANNGNAIGAQYLMKGVDHRFWARVEDDSEALYTSVSALNDQKKIADPSYHELQIWCADMWALLWNAWRDGVETVIDAAFDFSWGTSSVAEYERLNIFHNAGVTSDEGGMFYKAKYMNELPYNLDLKIDEKTSGYRYYELIKRTEKKSVLI